MPKSMEELVQLSGRAGRDGLEAHSIVYYKFADKFRIEKVSVYDTGTEKGINKSSWNLKKEKLDDIKSFCDIKNTCRRQLILRHFEENVNTEKCGNCDVCVKQKSNTKT